MSRTRKGYRNIYRAASKVRVPRFQACVPLAETLESRSLLTALPWTITGTSGADEISIEMENYMGNTYIRRDDFGSYTERRPLTDVSELIINGGAGNDTINIDSLDTVQVSISGQGDDDTITLGEVESLGSIYILGNNGNDTITLEDVHDVDNIVIAGGDGEDTFNLLSVKSITHTIDVFGYGGSRDTNDGTGEEDGGVVDQLNIGGGNLDDFGDVFFDDGDKFPADPSSEVASDPITIDDSNSTFATSWTVEDTGLVTRTRSGVGTFSLQISVFTVNNPLVVNAGSGNDSITSSGDMESVLYRYVSQGVTLNGHDGADTIIAGQGTGEFEINGGDGNDLLDVEGADFYLPDWMGPDSPPSSAYGTLNGGGGDDLLYVSHTSKVVAYLNSLSINGGDGHDTVEVDNRNFNDLNSAAYDLSPEYILITFPGYPHGGAMGAVLDTYEQFNLRMHNFDSGTGGAPSFTYNYNPSGGVVDPTPVTVYPSNINVSGTYLATDILVRRTDPGNPVTIMPSYGKSNVTVGDSIYGSNHADVIFGDQELGGPLPSIGALDISSIGTALLGVGSGNALKMTALTIASGGVFDISDGAAIIDYTGSTPMPTVQSHLQSGFNNLEWNGDGINSSIAAASFVNEAPGAVGSLDNIYEYGIEIYGGQAVDDTSVIVAFTRYGDADLNGIVDSADSSLLQFGYVEGTYDSWFFGNFNYDSVVDVDDFSLYQFGYTY